MADKRYGYLKVWNCIWETELFTNGERFDIRTAWLWLLMHAYYKPKTVVVNGSIIKAKRGQYFTSIRHLATEFHWDKNTVLRFLSKTQKLGMTEVSSTASGTLITIVNYNKYNAYKPHEDDDADTNAYTNADTDRDTDADTDADIVIKENNRIKNEKRKEKEAPPRRGGWGVDYE